MKKITYSILAVFLFIAAAKSVSAQSEQKREVSGFNSIASGGPFNVHVKIDGTESLRLTGDAAILDKIETVVEGEKLKIRFKHEYEHNHDGDEAGEVNIYITAKSLSGIANAGSGKMTVDGVVSGNNVKMALSGSGNITSSVKSDELHIAISGSGSVHLNGSAGNASISIAGSGELMGKELKTNTASVSIAGSGNAYVTAESSISAHIAGSGSVIYSGNASVSDSHTVGSGRVTKAN
ncbi:MAG: DUF2807 domain-containing protein [Bacteroidota bacterium]|nr:DUF2807 domain-containing protein [Bacteroidota bacterium]